MYALGIDPGPTNSGVAGIEKIGPCRFRWLYGGHFAYYGGFTLIDQRIELVGESTAKHLIRDVTDVSGTVAIEYVIGYAYEAKRVAALVDTSRGDERWLRLAMSHGAHPICIPNRLIREKLCLSKKVSDAQVETVIRGVVEGIPDMNKATFQHVADALAAAIVGMSMVNRFDLVLPPRVLAQLRIQQQMDEKIWAEKRAKKKAARDRLMAGAATEELRQMTKSQRAIRRSSAGRRRK